VSRALGCSPSPTPGSVHVLRRVGRSCQLWALSDGHMLSAGRDIRVLQARWHAVCTVPPHVGAMRPRKHLAVSRSLGCTAATTTTSSVTPRVFYQRRQLRELLEQSMLQRPDIRMPQAASKAIRTMQTRRHRLWRRRRLALYEQQLGSSTFSAPALSNSASVR